jgi:hypothetical protein
MVLGVRGISGCWLHSPRVRSWLWTGGELLLLAIWTLTVTRSYLNLDANVSPSGMEYHTSIQSHFVWDRLQQCGLCALWNGNVQGGYPAFAEIHDAMLHPVVIVASLLFGAVNGAKIALVAIFFLAGFAQWWLARELGLVRVARLWSGGMAVAAGNLAGRMDQGVYAVVVSTVAAALILPPMLRLSRDGRRSTAAVLGVTIGLLFVSGQGYLQIGVALMSPLLLLLAAGSAFPLRLLMRRFALALGIGLLLAAPFLVPFLHLYPSFGKFTDPTFGEGQPFELIPLNLVINDAEFFRGTSLGKQPYPFLYVNYVGWIAVLLALIGVVVLARRQGWLAAFFAGWAVTAMWIASAMPLKWIRDWTVDIKPVWEFVVGIRNPALIAGLAVPAVIALAAVGLDHLWRQVMAPFRIALRIEDTTSRPVRVVRVDPRWLLALLLIWGMLDARHFARNWLGVTSPTNPEIGLVLDALTTPSAAWIDPPFGERFWVSEAISRNLKLSYNVTVWHWKDRPDPQPVLEAFRSSPSEGMVYQTTAAGVKIYAAPSGNDYAAVIHADGSLTPCTATSHGGDVDVQCATSEPGQLQIKENWFSGWSARVDGNERSVERAGRWLGVEVPAGTTRIELRYRPWDVLLGLVLLLIGIVVAGYCLIRGEPRMREFVPALQANVFGFPVKVPDDQAAVAD